jgi:hypothetical protein
MTAKGDSSPAFLAWCLAGVGGSFGVLSILSVGAFLLLGTVFLSAVLLWRYGFGWSMGGLLSGAAVPLLYVAWLNRDGPGEVCTTAATSVSCSDEWSPWPFVVVAVVLAISGLVVLARRPHH